MKCILITPRSLTKNPPDILNKLTDAGYELRFPAPGKQPLEDELCILLRGCVGYLAGVEPITACALKEADALKIISRNGVGIDNIDQIICRERNIHIAIASGANSRSVAELTIALILSLVRSVSCSDASLKSENWQRFKGIELARKVLGLVGFGQIGRIVAELASGFGMRIIFFDPHVKGGDFSSKHTHSATFEEILTESDIISLHCPSNKSGPLIDGNALSKIKHGAYLINTSRAELVNNEALLKALDEGRLSGAAIDVFSPEPPEDWSVVKNRNVIATPHVGGFTEESVHRATLAAVENLLKYLNK